MRAKLVVSFVLLCALCVSFAHAQESTPEPTDAAGYTTDTQANVVYTETLPFDPSFLDRLTVPDGFEVSIFAQGLGNVRWMAVAPDGTIFVTRRTEGDVIALVDADGDSVADQPQVNVVASDLPYVHGILFNGNQMFLAADTQVLVADWSGGATISTPTPIIADLPAGNQHPNRTLGIGPDGLLYITIGSPCNDCNVTDPRYAAVLTSNLDGSNVQIFASGLRNTLGFGWHPTTSELWGFDHGSDWRGDDQPPEELNTIEQDGNYGWPWCYADQQPDLNTIIPPPGGLGREAYCERTVPAERVYTAHSAPIGMLFYTGAQFPSEYQNDAFVAMRGSWNREPPSGYKIVHVDFDEQGQPGEFTDFLTGFLIEEQLANTGRIAGLAIAPDGSLLVAEDSNGVIYRIAYTGGE